MKKAIVVMLEFVFVSVVLISTLFAKGEAVRDYYTRVNIWYENPEVIYSTNYHEGTMIPLGTKVEIVTEKKSKIVFKTVEDGRSYTIVRMKRHTNITTNALLNQYFSRTNIVDSSEYKALPKTAKKSIAAGEIELGMSKEAVLMAYGYPPTHRTPSTTSDRWIYWNQRARNFAVMFSNNVVTEIGERRPPVSRNKTSPSNSR
jgi:hypothetical protein